MSFMLSLIAAAVVPLPPRPEVPAFQVIQASSCDDPAERKRIFSGEATAGMNSKVADKYNQDWRTYLDARMEQLGMNKKEQADFAIRVLGSNDFGQLQAANSGLIKQMMADMDTITASKDEVINCRAIAHMTALLPQMVANADRQYSLMEKGLDEIAVRRAK